MSAASYPSRNLPADGESPGDDQRRPGLGSGVEKVVAVTGTSVTRTAVKWRCRHARLGYCRCCVSNRRRAQFELERVASVHHVPDAPARYHLDEDELRAEANRLHASGWTVDEVEQRLAIRRSA